MRSNVDEPMDKIQSFTDSMCQCKSAECALKLSDEMTKWAVRASKDSPQMNEAEMQRAQLLGQRMGNCMVEAMKTASAGIAPGLALTRLDPEKGDATGGTSVRIIGTAFKSEQRSARVYFGDTQGKVVKIPSDTEMIVEAPAGKLGKTTVLVVFEPGGERMLPGVFTYEEKK